MNLSNFGSGSVHCQFQGYWDKKFSLGKQHIEPGLQGYACMSWSSPLLFLHSPVLQQTD